jgi:sulfur relay (sulfurtransferase) complex TusBCD TusD component (DsrE family)
MKIIKALSILFVLLAGLVTVPVFAGDKDPLFVNMTTDEPHRANMAVSFGLHQMERGHPLTIFLNDKGVFVGSKANAGKFAEQQKILADVMSKGATVIACPMCMKHYGVSEADLLPGIKVGKPDLTGGALFRDDTKTLTW